MALLLRKIRKARWLAKVDLDWLDQGDIPADPLGDLVTKDNSLSVWEIDDDNANLPRVVAALASTGAKISNIDYALFEEGLLADLGIGVVRTAGGTPDQDVNENWHRDLIELSAFKTAALAKAIMARSTRARVSRKEVKRFIGNAVELQQIDTQSPNWRLTEDLS